jgi:hypothetical protein
MDSCVEPCVKVITKGRLLSMSPEGPAFGIDEWYCECPEDTMPNVEEWLRWEDSKWHLKSDNPATLETICGEVVPIGDDALNIQHFQSEFVPEDEHDVCLHCLRWREMKQRDN